MRTDSLNVITARFNPLSWDTPHRLYREWVEHMLDSGANLTVCELQYGDRPFICKMPHINHIGVRAETFCWNKENLLNLAYKSLPKEVQYICWEDSDIRHRNSDWVQETVEALQHYRIVQPWTQCLDMGPNDEVISVHRSFGDLYLHGELVTLEDSHLGWQCTDGAYQYGHPGFSWACRRELLDQAGGLLEVALMGSADYHMALGVLGIAEASLLQHVSDSYRNHILAWQQRASRVVKGRLGAVKGTIEHNFHGHKHNRQYLRRWDMFVKYAFDPATDIQYNTDGVIEWAGNKPQLEEDWREHMQARDEDVQTL
jgi:hypothetical protein